MMNNIQELIDHLEGVDTKSTDTFHAKMIDGFYIGTKYAVIRQNGTCYRVNLDTAQIVSSWS